jgi:hypothetical protein
MESGLRNADEHTNYEEDAEQEESKNVTAALHCTH